MSSTTPAPDSAGSWLEQAEEKTRTGLGRAGQSISEAWQRLQDYVVGPPAPVLSVPTQEVSALPVAPSATAPALGAVDAHALVPTDVSGTVVAAATTGPTVLQQLVAPQSLAIMGATTVLATATKYLLTDDSRPRTKLEVEHGR